ncbi:hypothetical protein K8R43_04915 [archaeon]|nr:hypothetical protein [archaeon]
MNELMEIRFKILELSYQYDKPIPQVMQDILRIKIEPSKPEGKKSKKTAKGKGS